MGKFNATGRRGHLLLSTALTTIVLATAGPTQAQTWSGGTSSDPFHGTNWVGGVPPVAGGNVIVTGPATHMPIIDNTNYNMTSIFVGHDAALGGAQISLINGANVTTTTAIIGEPSVNNAGNLLELDSGTANLSGASTWTTGNLGIGAFGTGVVDVAGGSTVTVNTSLNLGTHRNAITLRFGTGTLSISGAGSNVVSDGSTVIGAAGTGVMDVSSGGKLTTRSSILGQNAQGSGRIDVSGTGSRWDVRSGTTVIGQAGAGEVIIRNGATASTVALGGAGRIDIATTAGSAGSISVTGNGSQLDAGQIWAGRQSAATISATAGGVINATYLVLGESATGTGTATISGPGSRINVSTFTAVGYSNGAGVLTLSDGGTLRGLVYIAAGNSTGTLNIGAAAGSAAAAPGVIDAATVNFSTGTGTLVFNHTGTAYNFAPALAGTGTVRHLAGNTTFTGNSGAFPGTTQVEGGLLRVNGSLGVTNVLTGGTLGGNGTVGNTQINAGGAVAPDGTLRVAGNLTFADGSYYRVDAGNGTADSIAATGTVTINGGTVDLQQSTGTFKAEEEYEILSAGTALTGRFGGVSSQLVFLDPSLDYSRPDAVWLKLRRNDISFASIGTTPNQQGVGQALSSLPSTNPLVTAMLPLSEQQARDAMDQISGDTHSTLQTTNGGQSNQVQNLVTNRVQQSYNTVESDGATASYMPTGDSVDQDPKATFWLQGLGDYTHADANGGAGGISIGSAGLIGGADMVLLNDWRVGMFGGYARSSFSAIGRPASGSSDNFYAGIYAAAELDAVRLQFSAQHAWHGLSTSRSVAFGGFTDTLTASYGAQTTQVHSELGYVFDLGAVDVQPFGAISYALTNTPGFTETGGAAALTTAAASNDAVTTVLGTRIEAPFAVGDMLLTARGMLGWQYQHAQAATAQHSLAGSQPFTVTGANLSGHAMVYEAGVSLDISDGLNLDLVYGGRLSSSDVSHNIKGVAAAQF